MHFSIQVQLTLLINGSCCCVEGSWNNQAQCQEGKSFPCFSQNSQFIVVLLTRPVSEIFDISLCFSFRRIKLGLKVEIISQFFSLYTSFTSYCVVVFETNNEDSMNLKAVDNAAAISPFPAFRIKFQSINLFLRACATLVPFVYRGFVISTTSI